MGGGGEKKKTNAMLDAQNKQNQRYAAEWDQRYGGERDAARRKADDMYNVQYEGFKSLAQGGASPYGGGGTPGGGGGGGGALSPADTRLSDVEGYYRKLMDTGDMDADKLREHQGVLRSLMNPDADITNRFRGNGVYDEFSRTGGYSDADRANIRSRATSVIPSMYGSMRDEANRAASVQGGYGPGRAALMGRLARQEGSQLSDAARDAELGIMERVNEGRKWGATGATAAEGALQNLRFGASKGLGDSELSIQDAIRQGRMAGTKGLESRAEADRAFSASQAAAAAAGSRWDQEFGLRKQLAGLEGMQSLYGMMPGEVEGYDRMNLGYRGAWDQTGGRVVDQRMQNNPQRDWLGTAMGLAGTAGGFMTGLGNLGFGRGAR